MLSWTPILDSNTGTSNEWIGGLVVGLCEGALKVSGKCQQLRDIEVYVLARRMADRVWRDVIRWDRFSRRTVGEQLVRAADSVSANIAESYGRHHVRDAVRFLYYARGSLYETQDWLSKAVQRQLFSEEIGRELLDAIQVIAPKLNAYISAKARHKTT